MEDVSIKLETVDKAPERHDYTVLAEGGLFKNGKQYAKGDKVKLDIDTAARFKETGDIENA